MLPAVCNLTTHNLSFFPGRSFLWPYLIDREQTKNGIVKVVFWPEPRERSHNAVADSVGFPSGTVMAATCRFSSQQPLTSLRAGQLWGISDTRSFCWAATQEPPCLLTLGKLLSASISSSVHDNNNSICFTG